MSTPDQSNQPTLRFNSIRPAGREASAPRRPDANVGFGTYGVGTFRPQHESAFVQNRAGKAARGGGEYPSAAVGPVSAAGAGYRARRGRDRQGGRRGPDHRPIPPVY